MEQEQQVPQSYFTSDVEEKMREMGEKEMLSLLKDLEGTSYWTAILKYNQVRMLMSQSALFTGDPVKDPSGMSRQQGVMLGLSDMQNAIITLVQSAGTDVE